MRERFQKDLYLAEAEGHTEQYITMLVRLGRGQEAFDYGLKYLGTTQEALTLSPIESHSPSHWPAN